jgi:hypothetical protein
VFEVFFFLSFRATFCFANPDYLPPPITPDWRGFAISGYNREEGTGDWRKLQMGNLCNLFSSLVVLSAHIKEDKINGSCSTHGREENAYKTLVGKP